jgi:TolB protein
VERIVFTSQTSAGERDVEQVFSMNVDGSDRQQLTSNLDDSVDPAVLSDCSKVAFIVRSGDAWEVFVLDLASGDQAQVQGPAGRKMEPELSPDGSRVVFALETSGNESTLYVANVDGSDARPLTGSSFDEQDASWSPDGNSIAFVSDRDAPRQNHEVYRIAADGSSGPQRLTTQPGFDGEPSWSPDGGRIAFQSVRDADNLNNFSIWIMDATAGDQGAGLLKLTDQPGREHDPAWSPDGNAVAYTYEDAGTFDVYSVSATGGEPVKLTPDGPRDSRPSWCRS